MYCLANRRACSAGGRACTRLRLSVAIAVSLFGLQLAVNGGAAAASERERRVERIIDAISTSKTPLSFEKRFQEFEKLFARSTAADLEDLRFHDNLSIALTAAWEEVRLGLRPRQGAAPTFGGGWFVGYVEGRLGCPVPEAWGNVIAGAQTQDGFVGFEQPDRVPYDSSPYGTVTPGISIARQGDSFFLKSDDALVPFAPDIRKQLPRSLSVALGQQQSYAAVSSLIEAAPFPLFGIDSQSGKILWRAEAWGSGFNPFLSGPGFGHWVGLVRRNELLIAFGLDYHAAYIEGFAAADGSNVFRFSTAYQLIYMDRGGRR